MSDLTLDLTLDLGIDRRKAKAVGDPATGTSATSTIQTLVCAKAHERSVNSFRIAIHHATLVILPIAMCDQRSTDRVQWPMSPPRRPPSRPSRLRLLPLLPCSALCGLHPRLMRQKLRQLALVP